MMESDEVNRIRTIYAMRELPHPSRRSNSGRQHMLRERDHTLMHLLVRSDYMGLLRPRYAASARPFDDAGQCAAKRSHHA
jgi:hypothetical protein